MARKLFKTKKIGHGGTLDPMATGVLVLAVGKATRFLQFLQHDKEYRGVIRFGITTDSDDITGQELTKSPVPWLQQAHVASALEHFVGRIDQVPPKISALKQEGRRLYQLVRANQDVHVAPRKVEIHRIDLLEFQSGAFPEATIDVYCGSGTYIRSIARECGEFLQVGGTLASLVRTRSGAFKLQDSLSMDAIQATDPSLLWPIEMALEHLPSIRLSAAAESQWRKGSTVALRPNHAVDDAHHALTASALAHEDILRIYSEEKQQFLGISRIDRAHSDCITLRKRLFLEE